MNKKMILSTVLGISMVLTGCGTSQREQVAKSIENLQESYHESADNIQKSREKDYEMLGESIQALAEVAEKDSGELETEEEIEEAKELVEEFYMQLNEMSAPIEEIESGEESEQAEFAVTFRNDSQENLASLAVIEPETGTETELSSFESGKQIDTQITVNVDKLSFKWYLYDDVGQCVSETESDFADAREGIIIYYTDDGIYTESY